MTDGPLEGLPERRLQSVEGAPNQLVTSLSLLQRVRAHDQTAWQRLFYLYKPLVLYWCRRWGVRDADNEDVVQDVFRSVADSLQTFHRDQPGDHFRGWLRGITRNRVLMHLRRTKKDVQGVGGSEALGHLAEITDPAAELEEDSADQISGLYRRTLDLVRDEFETRTWQMFWLTVVENRSPTTVATEFGVTAATVRKAKSRVLHRLKEEMGELMH